MSKTQGVAEQIGAADGESISNIVDFDEQITTLRKLAHRYAELVEDLHNEARRRGIAAEVLAPLSEAAETAGSEIPESLLSASRQVRAKYSDAIEHAEAGVDLTFFQSGLVG